MKFSNWQKSVLISPPGGHALLCSLPEATLQEVKQLFSAPLSRASPRMWVLESPLPGPSLTPKAIEGFRWGLKSQEPAELPAGVSSRLT